MAEQFGGQRCFAPETMYDPFLTRLELFPHGNELRPAAYGMDYKRFAEFFAEMYVTFEHRTLDIGRRAAKGIEAAFSYGQHMRMVCICLYPGPQRVGVGRIPRMYAHGIPALIVGMGVRAEIHNDVGRIPLVPVGMDIAEMSDIGSHSDADVYVVSGSGHRIISAASPGMTAAYAFYRKPAAFHRSMAAQGLQGVLAACGSVTARRRKHRRDAGTVEQYRQRQ